MIQAMTNTSVPRITFMIGASFGAGNYGMCGRGYNPDFCFSWPNAMMGVMGGEQAAQVMSIIAEASAKKRGQEINQEQAEMQKKMLTHHFDSQSSAFYTSGRCLDDGVIDPRDTRSILCEWVQTAYTLLPSGLGPKKRTCRC